VSAYEQAYQLITGMARGCCMLGSHCQCSEMNMRRRRKQFVAVLTLANCSKYSTACQLPIAVHQTEIVSLVLRVYFFKLSCLYDHLAFLTISQLYFSIVLQYTTTER
jgi:hypothetical protein